MRNGTNVLGRVQVLGMLLATLAGVSVAQAQKPTVAIRSCEVRADIVGLTAVTTVEIVYVNYTNAQAEAQLQWSLPPDAAGADLSLWAGGLRAAGAIVPQVQARQIYDEIRNQRRDPALLEYQGSGQWSLRVFPIPANGTQKVQATFHQLLRTQNGWVRYDAPHVVSGTGTEAAEGIDVAMTIRAPGGVKDVRAVNHRVGVFRQGDGTVKAGWREENASLMPPVGIAYQPAAAAPAVVSFTGADKNAYFLAAVSRALDPGEAAARNVVVIVDVSASMKGRPIEAAMAVAQRVLKTLRQGERFSVVAAGSNVGLWKKQLVPATEGNVLSAIGYLEEAAVDGGGDLAGALRAAASLAGETTPVEALLISDGQDMIGASAGPEPAPKAASKPAPQGPANLRVHVIGVNSDSVAMSDLALRANGTMQGAIRDKTEADAIADLFVEQMREVLFENVKAVVKGQAQARNVVAAASGDAVFGGQVVKGGPALVDITGTRDGKPFHKELTIEIPEPGKGPEGWGSGDLEPVMAHLRAEGMWDDLHNNPNAKPDDLAALIAWSRQRRVATRATAFLVLETDGEYQQRGIAHQTASLAPEASLTDRLTEITPPAPTTPEPENSKAKGLLAQARELCRQGEFARAADCLDQAAGQVDGSREVRAQASLLRDFAAIRENARLAKQGDTNLQASYEGIPWDKTLLPPGPTDAIPLAGEGQPRRALVFPDIPTIYSDDDKAAKAKLRTSVTLEFAEKELGAVIEQISQATGVNIHVKWLAMENAEITARTPVSLKLKNLPADKALTILLGDLSSRQSKIAQEVEDGVVVISTQADLNSPLLTRAYDIADLLGEDTLAPVVPRRASPPPREPSGASGLFGSTSDMGGGAAGGGGFVGPRVDISRLGYNTASSGGSGDSFGSAAGGAGGAVSAPGPAAWRVGNRTYDIRDMVVAVPRFVSEASEAGRPDPYEGRSAFRDLVMIETGSENWKERAPDTGYGSLSFNHGRLIVTNSKAAHARVIQFLNDLRAAARARHVGGEARIAQARDIPEPLFTPDARLAPWVADLLALVKAGKLSEFSSVRIEPVGARKLARIGGVWFDLALAATAEIQIVFSQSGAGVALYKADPGLKACEKLGLCVVIAAGEKLALCFDDVGLISPDDPKIKDLMAALNPAKK